MRTLPFLFTLPLLFAACVGTGNENARLGPERRTALNRVPSGASKQAIQQWMHGPPQEITVSSQGQEVIEKWLYQYQRFVPIFSWATGGVLEERYQVLFKFDANGRLIAWDETSTETEEPTPVAQAGPSTPWGSAAPAGYDSYPQPGPPTTNRLVPAQALDRQEYSGAPAAQGAQRR